MSSSPDPNARPVQRGGRWVHVDMLRGIAVLLVLFRHHPSIGVLHKAGWMGVDLFFVLSGFLVSGSIFDEYRRTGSFKGLRFLVRRGFKIYPSFYAFLFVTGVLLWWSGKGLDRMKFIAEAFFFQNYHEGQWIHTWSLAVEEHFYFLLVIAAAVLIALRIRFRWEHLVVFSVLLFLACLALRIATRMSIPFTLLTHVFPTHLRIDSLMAGVLLAAWHRFRPEHFGRVFIHRRPWLFAMLLAGYLPAFVLGLRTPYMSTIGFMGIYLASAAAVGMLVARPPGRERSSMIHGFLVRPLAAVGAVSYTIYLWHLLVLLVVEMGFQRWGGHGGIGELAVFVVGTLLMGWLASITVEQPFLRLREKLVPARGRSTPSPALEPVATN